jgi:hypothetical protein
VGVERAVVSGGPDESVAARGSRGAQAAASCESREAEGGAPGDPRAPGGAAMRHFVG